MAGKTQIAKSSQGKQKDVYLSDPGTNLWIKVVSSEPEKLKQFLDTRPDLLNEKACSVSYNNTDD